MLQIFGVVASVGTYMVVSYPVGVSPSDVLKTFKARIREYRAKSNRGQRKLDKALAWARDPHGFQNNLQRVACVLLCNKLTQVVGSADSELVKRLVLVYGIVASGLLIDVIFSALKTKEIAPEACDRYLRLKGHMVSLVVLDVLFGEKVQALQLGHFADLTSSLILVPALAIAGWHRAGNSMLLKFALILSAIVSMIAQYDFHYSCGNSQLYALAISTFAFMTTLRATADSDVPPYHPPELVRRFASYVVAPLVAEIVVPISACGATAKRMITFLFEKYRRPTKASI